MLFQALVFICLLQHTKRRETFLILKAMNKRIHRRVAIILFCSVCMCIYVCVCMLVKHPYTWFNITVHYALNYLLFISFLIFPFFSLSAFMKRLHKSLFCIYWKLFKRDPDFQKWTKIPKNQVLPHFLRVFTPENFFQLHFFCHGFRW